MVSNNLEDRYNNGDIPLCYYCQLNGKSAVENYNLCHKSIQEKILENQLDKQLEEQIRTKLSKILEDELKGLLNLL